MRKLLALTLSLLMVFSVMPMVMVSAAGTYTVATGEEFVTAMADTTGATITLTADIVVEKQISLNSGGKGYSVDTQGFDITYANADPESTLPMFKFTQTWANTITFTNNTEDPVVFTNNSLGTWATSVSDVNTMKFVGSGAYSFPQGVTGDKFAVEIGVNNATTAPVFTGDIIGEGVVLRHKNGIINGDANVSSFASDVTNASTKTVTEMTFNGDITATGNVTFRRNTLYTVNGNVVSGGSLTLYGVTIPAGYTVQGKNVSIKNQNATTGATVINTDIVATSAVYATAGTVNGNLTADKIIAVGGTYAGDVTVASGEIFGGKYATDPTALAGVTVHADVTNDGTYYVLGAYTPVEIVSTGEKYATLAAAYNAAVEGDTIKLIGTLVHSSTDVLATIKKNDITIDLNGQTVTDFTDIIPNSDGRRFIEVSGTAVSKFTLTSSNGQAKIVLNGSTGSASRQIIRISNGNATEGADVTIENFDLTVPSSGGEANAGHRGFINVNGTAVAENNITIKNVKAVCDYTASTGNVGYSGFELGTKANYTIENCEVKGIWNVFTVSAAGSVVKVKDSTFGFQKTSCVGVSSASEVEFDNCVFEKPTLNAGTTVIKVSGASADVTIKNSDIYSGIEVTKDAKVALENCTQDISVNSVVALTLTTGGQSVSLKDYTINYSVKQSVNNNYAAFTLTGASGANVALDLENVTINEAYRVFRATNAYNEISISNLAFAKTSSTATFSANGNANITVADGEGYYVDEALTEEYVDFAWKTTKGQTLYIKSSAPVVEPTTYDVTIDGNVVATVEEGETFTLPALEAGKYYVGYEGVTEIVVTEALNLTTATYTYEVKVDGEVKATVAYGETYTLPALEAGKYYVGYEGVSEVVVTEALELTTATYTYEVTIDGVLAATLQYGSIFSLPAAPEGKQYVDGYVAGQEFVVTEALAFFTEDIPFVAPVVAITMVEGAQLRFNEVIGMRYRATVDAAAVAAYEAEGYDVEMGTLISPADIIGSFDALTFEADENNYIDVVTDGYYATSENEIAGSIVNIKETNIGRNYIARSYVKLTAKDGSVYVSYATETDNTRSVKFLANAVIDDDALPVNTAQVALIEKWAAAADWKK